MFNSKVLHSLHQKMSVLALLLLGLSMMLNLPQAHAQAKGGAGFDHSATAFPLTGSHEQVRCETCHIKGIFRSTPKDCASCHVVGNQRDARGMSAKHIPTPSAVTCDSCHNTSTFSAVQFNHSMVQPGFCQVCHDNVRVKGKSANHVETGGLSCDGCHMSSAFLPVATFPHAVLNGDLTTCASCHDGNIAKGMPTNHMPRSNSAQCGSCHINSTLNGFTSFAGGQMDHAGLTTGCVDCHGPSVTGSSFAGISSIVVMPRTSPVGASSHIPSSTTCESCHLGSLPVGPMSAIAAQQAPGSKFATPAPSTAQIHAGITGGCSNCHEGNSVWMGVSAYPISPTSVVAKAQYQGFQTRPLAVGSTYSVTDPAHPTAGDCSQCHTGTNYFTAEATVPANHIPFASAAQCNSCHTSTDFSVMPTLSNIHANAPSTSSNCAQCHGSNVRSYDIPAVNFAIVGLSAKHIPTSTSCEVCHVGAGSSIAATPVVNGAKFSGSKMSHAGITTNCVACHGPTITGASFTGITSIVAMPATSPMGATSHIPSSTTCESCHLATTPAGLVAANATKTAPGTAFATPAPTGVQIHAGISSGCNACHDTSAVWMGVSAYPLNPSTLGAAGTQYKGFQTRPKTTASTYAIADAAHPTTGDCSQCHSNTVFFSSVDKPANHIPYAASAQCGSCHKNTDYAVQPSLTDIHANAPSTSSNCAQCHGSNVRSYDIPLAGFAIVGLADKHIPTTASCESCHVGAGSSIAATPVVNGAKFSGSKMSHAGITTNCVACHGPTITGASFTGITSIVVMPRTSPAGASSHIPSSTTCESCHQVSSAAMAANAAKATGPGTAFLTPIPTTGQIHTGITGSCNSCHDTGMVWMSMDQYAIAPKTLTAGAQYTGFHSRPVTAASTYSVADAAHPTTGDCSQCHTGTTYFSGAAKPTGHLPTTLSCTTCHVVSGDYSVAGLTTNMTTLHTGISSGCITCHTAGTGAGPFAGCNTQAACTSPPPLTYQPKMMPLLAGTLPTSPSASTHVPAVGIACEKCHSPTIFTSFGGMNMKGNTPAHQAVGTPCIKCHEGTPAYKWYGVTIVTRAVGHEKRKAGQDCIACHTMVYSKFSGAAARVRPLMRGAAGTISQRFLPDGGLTAGLMAGDTSVYSHSGVSPGQCLTCHNGQVASGLPPVHKQTRMSCDNCHRTTAWKPAQFSHQGVLQGQCLTCHNSVAASGRPAGHFVTMRSCDTCHRTVAWVPVSYTHVSPLYQAQPGNTNCVICHVTNGEIIPRQMRGNNRPRPVPVHTGP